MCVPGIDPITMLTLAATAAGGVASARGAQINEDNKNAAIEGQNRANREAMQINAQARADEQVRQRQFEAEQAASVADALASADPAKALLIAEQEAEAPANPIASSADTYNAPTTPNFKNATVEAGTKPDVDKRDARTSEMADALALLTSIGTQFSAANRGIGRSGSEIATTGSYRRGSAGVGQQEAQIPAAEVTPADSYIGDILLLGGQAASAAGGSLLAKKGGIGDVLLPKKKLPPLPQGLGTGGLY